MLTARFPCGTGVCRYRCFLPDLTEFAGPPCTGPNYQQSTSWTIQALGKSDSRCDVRSLLPTAYCLLHGGEGGIRTLGTGLTAHTISSRAPSTARSPLQSKNRSRNRNALGEPNTALTDFLQMHRRQNWQSGNLAIAAAVARHRSGAGRCSVKPLYVFPRATIGIAVTL